ncbi:hypothetical protein [Dehalobacter restrictus]|uniref:Uncharacterized protein n=1 Tax=Dehalobacter restrictus TaxID=55583 RepID=A0A857DEX1_9FIRM|nr:hypothetical protein [Dehalobacter restrictus]QGZ99416.1 hypothetical protein GQ588_01420 [Dehalobacter restrictus]
MQDQLRERSKQYQEDYGVKSIFICKKLNIEPAYYCRWRKGQKDLNDECLNSLSEFLANRGY